MKILLLFKAIAAVFYSLVRYFVEAIIKGVIVIVMWAILLPSLIVLWCYGLVDPSWHNYVESECEILFSNDTNKQMEMIKELKRRAEDDKND